MRLNITKRDIELGWDKSCCPVHCCPVHRAIQRATGCFGFATHTQIGYWLSNNWQTSVMLRVVHDVDWSYLVNVMEYADGRDVVRPHPRSIKVTSTE